jgi:hypothetical protein
VCGRSHCASRTLRHCVATGQTQDLGKNLPRLAPQETRPDGYCCSPTRDRSVPFLVGLPPTVVLQHLSHVPTAGVLVYLGAHFCLFLCLDPQPNPGAVLSRHPRYMRAHTPSPLPVVYASGLHTVAHGYAALAGVLLLQDRCTGSTTSSSTGSPLAIAAVQAAASAVRPTDHTRARAPPVPPLPLRTQPRRCGWCRLLPAGKSVLGSQR